MPRGDKTGPNGEGPMTGRRMGYCAGSNEPGYQESNFNRGRNFGRGFGRGFGFRGGFDNVPNVSEKILVENEIRILKDQLSSLEKKLSETKNKD